MVVSLYTTFFYQPLFNVLVFIYNTIPGQDLGVAIIALTVLVRVLLYPLSSQSIKAQKMMQDVQPKLDALKKQFGADKEKLASATMQLYREEKVNPLSSCLPLLLQLPFFIALFQVFRDGTKPESLSVLYPFIQNPGSLQSLAFGGLVDLSLSNPVLALLAGAAQFWQGHMLVQRRPSTHNEVTKDEDFAVLMNQQMTYVMPVVTVVIAWRFPSGLALYWFLTTFLLALQQWHFFRKDGRTKVQEYAALPPTSSGPAR